MIFFIYEFICFMNSYMNSGLSRFQMMLSHWQAWQSLAHRQAAPASSAATRAGLATSAAGPKSRSRGPPRS